MLVKLFILFTVIPAVELFLLFKIAEWTSPTFTFGLVIATGFIGASLARWQGLQTWRKVQQELSAGRTPTKMIFDGFMIFVAGVLLITPGVLTDALGFSLLFPPTRVLIRWALVRRFKGRFQVNAWPPASSNADSAARPRDVIIEGHVIDPTDSKNEEA